VQPQLKNPGSSVVSHQHQCLNGQSLVRQSPSVTFSTEGFATLSARHSPQTPLLAPSTIIRCPAAVYSGFATRKYQEHGPMTIATYASIALHFPQVSRASRILWSLTISFGRVPCPAFPRANHMFPRLLILPCRSDLGVVFVVSWVVPPEDSPPIPLLYISCSR